MSPEEKLAAIEEIRQLKARYFRTMDTKDWAGLATIFAEDASFDATDSVRDGSGADTMHQKLGTEWINHGGANIAAFIRKAVTPLSTVHMGHVPEIEITSPSTAKGIWPFEDRVKEVRDGVIVSEFQGYGHYWETYERKHGRWTIKSSRITRLRVDFLTRPTP
jgi:hypothetical protein